MAEVTDDEASVSTSRVPEAFEGVFIIKDDNGYSFSHTFIDLDWTIISLEQALGEYLHEGKLHSMMCNGCAHGRKWKDTDEVYTVHGIAFPVKIMIGKINMHPAGK